MRKISDAHSHAFVGLSPTKELLLLVLIVFLLPSCATQMSLEEAKKVTVSISGTSAFAPPPRRIDDITSILEQPGQFDRKITERLIVQADAVPPKDAESGFYHKRAEAARQLGRPRQALDDLNHALLLSEKEGVRNPRILLHLALVERDIGNFGRALELLEESLRLARLSSTYRVLVETYIQAGDIEKARKTADSAKAFCAAPSKRRTADFYLWCDINALSTEAALLETQAKYAEAEKYIREQLQKISQNIKEDFPSWLINVRLWLAMNLMRQERFMEAEVEAREALK
jgi:tetratricopeptide (TPR) repeat protein